MEVNEREKYERAWDHPDYCKTEGDSMPELDAMPRIYQYLDPKPGETVAVFGVGSGRGAKKLRDERGCTVTGIDIAHNCLAEGVTLDKFVVANLWESIPIEQHDLGICVDVMEHIPPEHTMSVLSNISKLVGRAYFKIPFVHNEFLGMTMHLVVKQPDWWTARLKRQFKTVEYLGAYDWRVVP